MKHMTFRLAPLVFCALLVSAPALRAGAAAQPQKVIGPACDPGQTREHSYMIFEDRDGDGNYDYWIKYFCNGKVHEGEWDPEDMIGWEEGGTPIGTLPSLAEKVYLDLEITGTAPNGSYTWIAREKRRSDGALIAVTTRHANGSLTYVVLWPPQAPGQDQPDLGSSF